MALRSTASKKNEYQWYLVGRGGGSGRGGRRIGPKAFPPGVELANLVESECPNCLQTAKIISHAHGNVGEQNKALEPSIIIINHCIIIIIIINVSYN
jgi:hypothetical protein